MKIKDAMTRFVETIGPGDTLKAAAEKMRDHDIGALPVREGDQLLGIITDRDITVRGTAKGLDPERAKVSLAMTAPLVSCYEDQDSSSAAELMRAKGIRRLGVLTREERLVGLISLDDLACMSQDKWLIGEVLGRLAVIS